jgi:hypothetical protein
MHDLIVSYTHSQFAVASLYKTAHGATCRTRPLGTS